MPLDSADVQTAEEEGDSMAIDEEGRPRFAPARDIVSLFRLFMVSNFC